jgi:hypothetical protein
MMEFILGARSERDLSAKFTQGLSMWKFSGRLIRYRPIDGAVSANICPIEQTACSQPPARTVLD